jgi:hypothetical protein
MPVGSLTSTADLNETGRSSIRALLSVRSSARALTPKAVLVFRSAQDKGVKPADRSRWKGDPGVVGIQPSRKARSMAGNVGWQYLFGLAPDSVTQVRLIGGGHERSLRGVRMLDRERAWRPGQALEVGRPASQPPSGRSCRRQRCAVRPYAPVPRLPFDMGDASDSVSAVRGKQTCQIVRGTTGKAGV